MDADQFKIIHYVKLSKLSIDQVLMNSAAYGISRFSEWGCLICPLEVFDLPIMKWKVVRDLSHPYSKTLNFYESVVLNISKAGWHIVMTI